MDEDQDAGEKTEEPSQYRIDEFRKRGEVASSKELANVLVLSACIFTIGLSLAFIFEQMQIYIEWLYTLDISSAYTEKSIKTIFTKTFVTSIKCVAPVFASSLAIGVASNLMQVGFLFSPEVLELKLDRINPVNGVKRLFSMKSLVEAIKGVFKFIFILTIVYFYLKDEVTTFAGFLHVDISQAFLYGKSFIIELLFAIILGLAIIAAGDFAYQKFSYRKKLMMTKDQAKRESKEKDGNPEIKQRIRQIQREASQKRMMADIPTADVIVTNPTHISVALKFDSETMVSPQVIGKGADFLALRIREIANEHNIPIVENVPLARGLYKTVKVNQFVPRTLYKAVAEVLAFVYKMKRKKKALS